MLFVNVGGSGPCCATWTGVGSLLGLLASPVSGRPRNRCVTPANSVTASAITGSNRTAAATAAHFPPSGSPRLAVRDAGEILDLGVGLELGLAVGEHVGDFPRRLEAVVGVLGVQLGDDARTTTRAFRE